MANRSSPGYMPGMLTLYLLRHGQTSFSKANAFCGAALNPDLTDDGRQMAELQSAPALVSLGFDARNSVEEFGISFALAICHGC